MDLSQSVGSSGRTFPPVPDFKHTDLYRLVVTTVNSFMSQETASARSAATDNACRVFRDRIIREHYHQSGPSRANTVAQTIQGAFDRAQAEVHPSSVTASLLDPLLRSDYGTTGQQGMYPPTLPVVPGIPKLPSGGSPSSSGGQGTTNQGSATASLLRRSGPYSPGYGPRPTDHQLAEMSNQGFLAKQRDKEASRRHGRPW